jgi:hypothetical protein
MAVATKRPGFSWMWFLLLSGLSILAWISTYTGIMELIIASTGEVGLIPSIAVGFAVFMLQLMILYVLDAMFSGQLRWWLWPAYIIGYAILFLISVGFAFGFYWKYLEAGSVTTREAEVSIRPVQQNLQYGMTRLEQMQSTFTTLAQISQEKAERERTVGRTCAGSPPGDGPRRRLRESDAERFQFANQYISSRVQEVKVDIEAVNADLQRIQSKDPTTIDAEGSRRSFINGMNGRLAQVATRFNALRTDPQLLQLRDEFATRAERTRFDDGRGGTFLCPDPQLQTAINGVVRSINELPAFDAPVLATYEGSAAVIEAFSRLTNSGIAAWNGFTDGFRNMFAAIGVATPAPERPLRTDGLTERDYIPLIIAIFVDICILLVSINRPFGPFFDLTRSMEQARHGGMSDFLATFYRVFQDQFDPSQAPTATDVIAPIQDVVFDHRGLYYAAVPLDFRERNYKEWLERRVGRERAEQIFEATSDKPLEESRYITSVFAALEGTDFITLIDPAREGFVSSSPKPDEQARADPQAEAFRFIRTKLDQQGSVYAQADAFRVYRFREKAWGQILIQSVGSSAAQSERNWRRQTRGARRPVRTASDQAKALAASEEFRGEAKAVEGPPKKVAEQVSGRPGIEDRRPEAVEKKEPQKLGFVEGVDEDRDPDHYGDGAQKLNGNPKPRDVTPEGEKPKTRET